MPSPTIVLTTTPEPHQVGQRFDATCLVNTIEGLSESDINIEWYYSAGNRTDRVVVGHLRVMNSTTYARDLSIVQLDSLDSGSYLCRASISGQYVYSGVAENTRQLIVGGGGEYLFSVGTSFVKFTNFVLFYFSVTPSCVEGDFYPLGLDQVSAGVLRIVPGVCLNGRIGSICSRGFDNNDATVVCRAFGTSINQTSIGNHLFASIRLVVYTILFFFFSSFFFFTLGGRGVNNTFSFIVPINVQDLNCFGYESSIGACLFNRTIDSFCMDESNTAAVECYFQGKEV